ncbi:MAG: ABC transporter ATP-binding protein [Deltaproteobacteria bacterium]|nr:ABC transporter ATP-binding protein [Deltaproteobacteria bacterium]
MSQSTSTPVLRTHNLAKTFALGFFRKKVHAVRDVSLEVKKGEIFGLLGPNGAGKTTTLKVLMGLIKPTAGSAEVFGRPAGHIVAKAQLGYLPESPYFYDYLTSLEFLVLVGELCGLRRRESRLRAEKLLERVELSHAANLALRRYSKGMLQRVGLAQALINNPQLVVLDEPLTGLDPLGRKQLRELIAELRNEGKTVVLSSHILSDVEALADRVAILVKGRMVASGKLSELLDTRVINTEITISSPPEALVKALAAHDITPRLVGDVAHFTLEQESATDEVVDLIRTHGARLMALIPRKESLEDVVVRQAAVVDAQSESPNAQTPNAKTGGA